jgi:predicted tellurium resistance membrane protein TerC
MELGAAAVLIAGMVCALLVLQVLSLWRAIHSARRMTAEVTLRSFAGLGALALLLHSWVEFNMHIPALAITAAFLAGTFIKPLGKQPASSVKTPRARSVEPDAQSVGD